MNNTLADRLRSHGIAPRNLAVGDHHMACPRASRCGAKNVNDPCLSLTIKDDRSAVWQCHRGHCGWTGYVPSDERAAEDRPKKYRRPTYVVPPTPDERMIRFFADRKIPADVVRAAEISVQRVWMPGPDREVDCIAYPYFRDGSVVNVKYRSIEGKYFRQEKDAEKILYGLDDIISAETGVIVEGETDKLAFLVAMITQVVSVPDGAPDPKTYKGGGTKKFDFLHNCADRIESVKKWIIATDNDPAGRLLADELARRIGYEKCWRVRWPDAGDVEVKDANDVLCQYGASAVAELLANTTPYPIHGVALASDYGEAIDGHYAAPREEQFGLPWESLHRYLRIGRRQIVVVTGLPGSGKSEWVENVAIHLARAYGWKFAIASFEHEMVRFVPRLSEKVVGKPFYHQGHVERMSLLELHEAIDWLDQRFFHIRADDISTEPTLDWVLDRAAACVLRYGVNALIIDPWNELEMQKPAGVLDSEYLAASLRRIKRFAWNHDLTVIVVAHPAKPSFNAKGEMNKLTLYSINGGATWFNKMDVGVIVHRMVDEVETEDEGWVPRFAKIDVNKMKWKQFGRVGSARLKFDRATGIFTDAPEEPPDDLEERAEHYRNKGA
jgi:twinkle protein